MDFVKKTINLRRVVITGLGMISPVGKLVPESWENVKNGKTGIGRITRFDTEGYYSQIAGEVKGYDPYDYFDRKELRKLDPFIQFALIAADEAIRDSNLKLDQLNVERIGVYVGSGIGGIFSIEANHEILMTRGFSRISPFFLPAAIANLATGQISMTAS